MRIMRRVASGSVILAVLATATRTPAASFTPIPEAGGYRYGTGPLALDVSNNAVVVGESSDHLPLRWTPAEGLLLLSDLEEGEGEARGVSADGSVVVGGIRPAAGGGTAFRWTSSTGLVELVSEPSSNAKAHQSVEIPLDAFSLQPSQFKPPKAAAVSRFRVLDAAAGVGVDTEISWFLNMLDCHKAWEITKGRGAVVVVVARTFTSAKPRSAVPLPVRSTRSSRL